MKNVDLDKYISTVPQIFELITLNISTFDGLYHMLFSKRETSGFLLWLKINFLDDLNMLFNVITIIIIIIVSSSSQASSAAPPSSSSSPSSSLLFYLILLLLILPFLSVKCFSIFSLFFSSLRILLPHFIMFHLLLGLPY